MTAISTFISLYKQKYYTNRISRQSKKSLDETAMAAGADATKKNIKNNIYNTAKWVETAEAAIANVNVGLQAIDKMHQNLNASILEVVQSITFFEERESKLTQTFKVGTKELALRTKAYNGLQTTLKATNQEMVRFRANMEANSAFSGRAFKNAIASNNEYIKRQITAQSYLAKNTNLTDEQIRSLELYSAGSGRALDRQVLATKELSDALEDGISSSETNESILASIADLSSDIRMQYKGMGGNLEMAVLKAKRLGIAMEQLHKTGEGLLNIEKSVGDELQYQLLSGKRLVDSQNNSLLNAYREAVYQGDMTKQAEIMNQILETQADVLNGRNFAAKQQLATTLDMSAKDLMYMKEKKDLQDLINKSGAGGNVDAILKSKEALDEFKANIKMTGTKGTDILGAISRLQQEEAQRRSPAESILMELRSIRQTGLNVNINNKDLDSARTAATSYRKMAEKPFANFFSADPTKTNVYREMIGRYQIINKSMDTYKNTLSSINQHLPYFGTKLSEVSEKIVKIIKTLTGANVKLMDWKIEHTPAPSSKHEDAILNINDGVIAKFHPNDKITTVVASPYGAMNERIASKIANPKSNNSSTAQIMQLTAAINKLISTQPAPEQTNNKSIVSAIQTAMGNVNITVALDPMAIDKEIKFRSGNLNG